MKLPGIKILILALMLFYSSLNAQNSADTLFNKANNYYESEKYKEAITLYESIIENDLVSPELYYNLGNAYYRSNKPGRARLNYERALLLSPNDPDILLNLEYLENNLSDRFEVVPEFFLTKGIKNFLNLLPSDTWILFSMTLFALFFCSTLIYIFTSSLRAKKTGFYSALIFFVLSALTLLFSIRQLHHAKNPGTAIVMEGSLVVKSSPRQSGKELFILHEGTKVWIEESIDMWTEIRIPDGRKGWVENNSIEKI